MKNQFGLFVRVFVFIFLSSWLNSVFSQTNPVKDGFSKRFVIDRNEQGEVVAVRSKQIITKFSLIPFLKLLFEHIAQIPQSHKDFQSGEYQKQVEETIGLLQSVSEKSPFTENNQDPDEPTQEERIAKLKDSFDYLPKVDFRPLVDQLNQDPDLKEFEKKLPDLLATLRPDVLARPNDTKFFFNKALIERLVGFILTQAANRLPSVPYLGLLQGLLEDVQNILTEQRTYQQNILIAYLINFKSQDLGMTDLEVNKILSSIYVSHLGVQAFNQLRNIEARWMGYGWNEYYTVARNTDNRLSTSIRAGEIDTTSQRIDMSFAAVTSEGGKNKRILNMTNNMHMFSRRPTLAYDYEKPNRVKMFRLYLRLGQIGLDFLNIPAFIKNFVNQFADSFYRPQRLTEGSMIGYLEIFPNAANDSLKQNILTQSLHPYLK